MPKMAQSSRPWAPSLPERAGRAAIPQWPLLSLPAVRWAFRLAAVAIAGSWLGYYLITQPPYLVIE